MMNPQQVNNAINLVTQYPLCIAWEDYRTPVWVGLDMETEHRLIAEVRICLPQTDPRFLPLMRKVAGELKATWVTYPQLTNYFGRLLSLGDYQAFTALLAGCVKFRQMRGLPVR